MTDYKDLNLNEHLQPSGVPISADRGYISAYDINSTSEFGIMTTQLVQDRAITNAKIVNLDASKITAGTVVVGINLGTASSGYLLLDGANNRIVVNDGTTNRIVIGNI